MCEFISWIEAGSDTFFLTDKDITSKFGKEKLKGMHR